MDYDQETIIGVDLSDDDLGRLDPYYGAIPPASVITSTGIYDTTVPITVWSGGTGSAGTNLTWQDSILPAKPSAKITLTGEDADIEINGESLTDMIRGIQERLNILCPDPDMEAEWEELRAIREQYEAKLSECREKSRAWKALQQKG